MKARRSSKLYGKEAEIVSLYNSGISGVVLAKKYFVNRKTIYRILRKYNIRIKTNSESHNALYKDTSKLNVNTVNYLNGWLLGDGSLVSTNTPQTNFTLTTIHKEYANYVYKILNQDIRCEIYNDKRDKYKNNIAYIISTKRTKHLKEIYNRWYKNGTKMVPDDLDLTKSTISNWIMDDGSLDKSHNTIHLYTCSFSIREIELLVEKLKKIANNNHISICNYKKYPYIYVGKKASAVLIDYVGRCPTKCFEYKWDMGEKNA